MMTCVRAIRILLVFPVCFALLPLIMRAQEKEAKPGEKPAEAPAQPPPQEESSVTDHSIKIGGQTIPYKATAQTILLKNDKGEPTALLYSTAYTRSDVKDPSPRPLAFLYNGGPGSSSVWLHMGSFSPKRVMTVNANSPYMDQRQSRRISARPSIGGGQRFAQAEGTSVRV